MRVALADCELDAGRHELRRAGEVVALEPQVFDVPAYLARSGDRLVTTNEPLDEVWGGRCVSESALAVVDEARDTLDEPGADRLLVRASRFFEDAGQVLDAARCYEALGA